MEKKRILTIAIILALAILAAATSWFLGSRIQSPAEAAARTAPPEPSPILVPAEMRVLTADVVARGTARFGEPHVINLAPSTLKPSAGMITSLPAAGSLFQEGDVLLTTSGRPVFVLEGDIPAYRDYVPGISGDDVTQLERGLQRLGFNPGPMDGTFDVMTGAAISEWYESAGWQPFSATPEQQANVRTLEQQLSAAMSSLEEAETAAATAVLALAVAEAEAEAANKAVMAEVAAATTEADREIAQAKATAIQLRGGLAVQRAFDARITADRQARIMAETVERITADLEEARRQAGIKLPLDEIVFVPTLPLRVNDSIVALGDVAGGPALTATNEQIIVDSSLPLDEAKLVQPEMAVIIDEPDLGISTTGVVGIVAETPGTNGLDGYHIYFEVIVDNGAASLAGVSLRLRIPVETTVGSVTVVPISALSLAPDGSSRVQVSGEDGSLTFIVVEPGLSADGYVEVTPLENEILPGQLVVIGFQ